MNHPQSVNEVYPGFLVDHDVDHSLPSIKGKTFGTRQIQKGDKEAKNGLHFGLEGWLDQLVLEDIDQEFILTQMATRWGGASVLIPDIYC